LANTAAKKVLVARAPGPGAAARRRDGRGDLRWRYSYALFGGGLLGFEIGAGLAAA